MAAITSEFATAAKAKAHHVGTDQQPSLRQIAADAAEVNLTLFLFVKALSSSETTCTLTGSQTAA